MLIFAPRNLRTNKYYNNGNSIKSNNIDIIDTGI